MKTLLPPCENGKFRRNTRYTESLHFYTHPVIAGTSGNFSFSRLKNTSLHTSVELKTEKGGISMGPLTVISLPYSRNKSIVLRSCLVRQGMSFEEEVLKYIDTLYEKYVTKDIKDLVDP